MAQIKDNRPADEEGRVRLRKAVIAKATAFLALYKKPKVINPLRNSEQNILTNDLIPEEKL